MSAWALRKARERIAHSYRPGGFDGPYVLELLHNTPPQSATTSSNQQQPGDCRWSSLIDADREQESKDGAHPPMQASFDAEQPSDLTLRIREIGALPEEQQDPAWHTLEVELGLAA